MAKQPEVKSRKAPLRLLKDKDFDHVAEFINKRAKGGESDPCQVCGSAEAYIQPSTVTLDAGISEDGRPSGFPSIVTICYNCGFTRYFNALILGLSLEGNEERD
jgi:predicted nucleic-acid-binding Zn-ribbon protein